MGVTNPVDGKYGLSREDLRAELDARFEASIEAWKTVQRGRREARWESQTRRAHGLRARHRNKLNRKDNAMDRNRCHVIGQHTGQQCTGEPLDPTPEAEIKICTRHAALVLELVNHAKTAHFTSKETDK